MIHIYFLYVELVLIDNYLHLLDHVMNLLVCHQGELPMPHVHCKVSHPLNNQTNWKQIWKEQGKLLHSFLSNKKIAIESPFYLLCLFIFLVVMWAGLHPSTDFLQPWSYFPCPLFNWYRENTMGMTLFNIYEWTYWRYEILYIYGFDMFLYWSTNLM